MRTSKRLNLTRCFGDFGLKQDTPPIISCQPNVEILPLSDEKESYVLIAGTDGQCVCVCFIFPLFLPSQ